MLILQRRLNEKILIGDDIEVMVSRITEHQVRLSIKAPRHIEILRDDAIHRYPKPKGVSDADLPRQTDADGSELTDVP